MAKKVVYGFPEKVARSLSEIAGAEGLVPNPRLKTSYAMNDPRMVVTRSYLLQPLEDIGTATLKAGSIALGKGPCYVLRQRRDDTTGKSQLEYHRDELDDKVILDAYNYTDSTITGSESVDAEQVIPSGSESSSSSSSTGTDITLVIAVEDVFGDLYIVRSLGSGGSGGSGSFIPCNPAIAGYPLGTLPTKSITSGFTAFCRDENGCVCWGGFGPCECSPSSSSSSASS